MEDDDELVQDPSSPAALRSGAAPGRSSRSPRARGRRRGRASIAIADLAVSPDDPDTIVVTTEQGLSVSTDGAETLMLVQDAPLMVLVTWTDEGAIVGWACARLTVGAGPT